MKALLLFFVPFFALAQSSLDQHRWYLQPNGEEIKISIDDLHDETLIATPKLQWGREFVPQLVLKIDVTIAVIDGGVEIEHPELKDHIAYNDAECFEGNIIPPKDSADNDQNGYKGDCAGWDFVENHNRPEDQDGHGTHVTGLIRTVMKGVQGRFQFLPLKVFAPNEGRQDVKVSTPLPVRLTKAFDYAVSRNVDAIHLSVGWPKSIMTFDLEEAIKRALKKGILIIAASGNSSQRATIYPCQMEGVVCVGALRPDGTVARFSNWGSQVDIYAPGEKILSTIPYTLAPLHISRRGYDFKNGTSQAAPFITGLLALLRGAFPEENMDSLYARMMDGADEIPQGQGLKGMFHLEKSVRSAKTTYLFPVLKGLHSLVVDDSGYVQIKIPLKNFMTVPSKDVQVKLTCGGADFGKATLPSLAASESKVLTFGGQYTGKESFLNCDLEFLNQSVGVRLKVLKKLKGPLKRMVVKQDELLVINTRNGARSRFTTVSALKGGLSAPLYYVQGDKSLALYAEDRLLGSPRIPENCSFLRIWQIDFNNDHQNDFMLESLCDKNHLRYFFFDQRLQELYPAVNYRPTVTVLNYDDFEVILKKDQAPTFRFVNFGFALPTETPWDSDETSKEQHYYELYPAQNAKETYYNVRILEEPEKWKKSLKLRYLPAYEILHEIDGRLLIKIGGKTAWVELKDQSAVWAGLDNVLLAGGRKQSLIGSTGYILQSFLTPFEYRGFLLNGTKLRFIQENRLDPLIDILGTEKNDRGYKTVIRSFQKLIYLQYSEEGNLLERRESTVERFDFLTAQDLIASVANLSLDGKLIQLVDGTKVNTNYVDLITNGQMESFEIPSYCTTQNPVYMEGILVLPVFCAKSKIEFEMRFIDLKN